MREMGAGDLQADLGDWGKKQKACIRFRSMVLNFHDGWMDADRQTDRQTDRQAGRQTDR